MTKLRNWAHGPNGQQFPIVREKNLSDTQIELIVSRFEIFLLHAWATWQSGKMERLAPLGVIELEMAAWAAGYDCTETGRGLLAPRGIGKSHVVTVGLSSFRLLRDPDRKVILISKSIGHAKKAITLLKNWMIEIPILKHLQPRAGDTANKQFLDVRGSSSAFQNSISAYGIESQIPGNRGHTVITDDTETKTNTKTVESRKTLDDQHRDFRSLLYGSGPEDKPLEDWQDPVELVDVGTRHHDSDSVYDKKSKRGYAYRSWSLCIPRPDDDILNLAPSIAQAAQEPGARRDWTQLTCPHLFSTQDLAERRAEGDITFGMQQMLLRSLGNLSRFELRLENLIIHPSGRHKAPAEIVWGTHSAGASAAIEPEELPCDGLRGDRFYRPVYVSPQREPSANGSPGRETWLPYTAVHAWIDPPNSAHGDRMGFAIVAALNGMFHWLVFLELAGGHDPANVLAVASLCRDYRVRKLFVEGNNGGDASSHHFRTSLNRLFLPAGSPDLPEGWGCNVDVQWSSGQKEPRILDTLNTTTRHHRLVIHPDVARSPEFQRQFTRLTREKNCLGHEDGLESGASCIETLKIHLDIDPAREEELRRQTEMDAILKEHHDHWHESGHSQTPVRTRVFLDA